jgi:hypothetical protein
LIGKKEAILPPSEYGSFAESSEQYIFFAPGEVTGFHGIKKYKKIHE